MTVKMDHVNQVELRGSIVHKFKAGNWITITLGTSVNQNNRDFPSIYWYDEFVEEIDKKYNVGDRVSVVCTLRTSRAHPDQSLVGIAIEPLSGWIDAKFNAGDYKTDFNEVLIKGEFVRVYNPGPDLAVVTLKTVINGYTYFPRVTCFGKHVARATEIEPGQTVYFVAHVQTRKKETAEGVKHYQSVVCRNMRVS